MDNNTGNLHRSKFKTGYKSPEFFGKANFEGINLSVSGNMEKPFWFLEFLDDKGEFVGKGVFETWKGQFAGDADLNGDRVTFDIRLEGEGDDKHFEYTITNQGRRPEGEI